jgi:hypothetical protein
MAPGLLCRFEDRRPGRHGDSVAIDRKCYIRHSNPGLALVKLKDESESGKFPFSSVPF